MPRAERPPPGSNLGRAWTQLRRDRDRAVSISKDCVALLNDMNRQGEIPARFELTIDSLLCRLANLLGAERGTQTADPTASDITHHERHHEGATP